MQSQKKSDRPYKCEKCLKRFRCKDNLILHVLIHIENTGNGNQFANQKILKTHFESVHDVKVLKCQICNAEFNEQIFEKH